jgi:hypothetical protein
MTEEESSERGISCLVDVSFEAVRCKDLGLTVPEVSADGEVFLMEKDSGFFPETGRFSARESKVV